VRKQELRILAKQVKDYQELSRDKAYEIGLHSVGCEEARTPKPDKAEIKDDQ
jgi:hypothetical protein